MSANADARGEPGGDLSIGVPTYTRKATGLVREVSLTNQIIFNATSTSPIGTALVFGLFSLVVFPRANPYIALIVAIILGIGVWTTFALLSAAIPRIGGDYTFNSRILHPLVGFAGNLCVFVSTAIAMGLWGWWFGTQALSPAFSVIGSVTDNARFTRWGADLAGGPDDHWLAFAMAVLALLITSVLAMRGTRTVVRVMSILFVIAAIGFFISMIVLLFEGNDSFRSTVDSATGAGTYQHTVDAAKGQGLLASDSGGYSTKATIGAIYSFIGVTLFVWWGTYMSAEFKGAGQRRRQLTSMVGAGVGQGLIVLLALLIFLKVVGLDFFTSALAGNYSEGPVGSAGYAYFSALVADNSFFVTLLALAFVGWWLPGLYINQAMAQRAFFTWSFDGLAPRKLSEVDERTHTPVVAIVLSFLVAVAAAAWVTWDGNFFRAFAIMQVFAYIPIVFVGLAALVMPRRRPDLYKGSPAEWRLAGIPVLPVAGVWCTAVGIIALGLVYYFHENLGLTNDPGKFPYYTATILAPFVVAAIAAVWWFAARSYRKNQGVDLDLVYRAIPPD